MKNLIIVLTLIGSGFVIYQQAKPETQQSPDLESISITNDLVPINGQPPQCRNPIAVYEDPSRKPLRDFVLAGMGDLSGKIIVDIGAGPGFFAFEMAKQAKKVIATELDPLFLNYMGDKLSEEKVKNFEVTPALSDHSELVNLEADYALMVYVFHYLEDPKTFLKQLKKGLKPGGKVFIANNQLSSTIIKDYLEMAGFGKIEEANFTSHVSGCGRQKVQLISGELMEPRS